jgi:hypothetical protein
MTTTYYFTEVEMFGNTKRIIMFKDNDATLWSIPDDPNNTDYQKYLSWVEAGNTAQELIPDAN